VVGVAVACRLVEPVVESAAVVVDVEVEPPDVVVVVVTAAVDTSVLPDQDAAATAPNAPTAATLAMLVPIVMARSRATARSRSTGFRRGVAFMTGLCAAMSFEIVTTNARVRRRHTVDAGEGHPRPVSFLGELGSALFGAAYEYRIPIAIAAIVTVVAIGFVGRRRGWLRSARSHPGRTVAILIPALALALPLGWYLGSPLFLTTTIDEPVPTAAASSQPASFASPSASASASADRPSPASTPTAATDATTVPAPLLLTGTFHGSDDFHFGRGTAGLIETSPGVYVVRLEDFAVRNGPDLYVYLSPSADGYDRGAIELGRLKADTGNQNYAVPAGALREPGAAASVVIWCKQFSHLFATAPLRVG
jgi:hypothetical protein